MTAKLDASAIIYLGKVDLLTLAAQVCGGLVVTTGVYEEAVMRGRKAGHHDAETIEKAVQDRLVQVVTLKAAGRKRLGEAGFPPHLGNGEQETIVEALEQECLAVLDDARARAAAVVLGTTICRTETLLVEALVRNLIDLGTFEAALLRLARVKGMRPDDLAELLRLGRLIEEVLADERANTDLEQFEG
jgi:predicted nucleic acid-binding protein